MAILSSCQDDITVTNDEQSASHISENPYSISEESALAYLADFLADSEPDSRSGKKISVKSIQPIKYNRVASRTQQDDTDCENLLYVANFEEEPKDIYSTAIPFQVPDSSQLQKPAMNCS